MTSFGRIILAAGSAALLLLSGCSSDCERVCEKWNNCFGTSTDGVESCTSECETKADNDAVYAARVESCWKCTEEKSCSESSACAIDCLLAVAR